MSDEKISWHRYVRVHLVPAYEGLGWVVVPCDGPMSVPHGFYGVFMEFDRPGDPVEPPDEWEAIGGGAE